MHQKDVFELFGVVAILAGQVMAQPSQVYAPPPAAPTKAPLNAVAMRKRETDQHLETARTTKSWAIIQTAHPTNRLLAESEKQQRTDPQVLIPARITEGLELTWIDGRGSMAIWRRDKISWKGRLNDACFAAQRAQLEKVWQIARRKLIRNKKLTAKEHRALQAALKDLEDVLDREMRQWSKPGDYIKARRWVRDFKVGLKTTAHPRAAELMRAEWREKIKTVGDLVKIRKIGLEVSPALVDDEDDRLELHQLVQLHERLLQE